MLHRLPTRLAVRFAGREAGGVTSLWIAAALALLFTGQAFALSAAATAPRLAGGVRGPSGPVTSPAAAAAVRAAPPVSLAVPRIGVDTRVDGLGLGPGNALDVPADYARAGWYRLGVAPGDAGPTVFVGHVDSHTGPAVFYRLSELQPGDAIDVRRADGVTVTFTVNEVRTVEKDNFPTEDVYGATENAQIRLITCGGEFDFDSRHYRHNVVVFGSIAPPAGA